MDSRFNGILEQVFIEQAIDKLEEMKYKLGSDTCDSVWQIEVLSNLIDQFYTTNVGSRFNHILNQRLDQFWLDHSHLLKNDILLCGSIVSLNNDDDQVLTFLNVREEELSEYKSVVSEKLELKKDQDLYAYLSNYFDRPMKVVRLRP
ncbi:hypothetical protein [Roseivirga sp. E12]|uniref:hypothetical protein n=1 Tax=Roseivirga sp. E12 TaxID=2819237 RepID=UPI001ABBF198|nr:hypothetical protein [Roseivirga sp. E12]MBO3699992.1 hypothetical protein [Roseivirga sp. E12]